MIPCILFEDAHLLAIHKPSGIATHRAAVEAPWGIVEFLQSRRSDLSNLGIHQRLDRETSGILLFAKTSVANQSLAAQFESRSVRKTYLFVSCGRAQQKEFVATDFVGGKAAKTHFRFLRMLYGKAALWEARPETGRTHQVRIHAATHGLPIVGDVHNPSSLLEPLLLHAASLEILHPTTSQQLILKAPMPVYFECDEAQKRRFEAAIILRKSLLDENETNAYRFIHRESDGFPNLTIDRLNDYLYIEDFSRADEKDRIKLIQDIMPPFFRSKFNGIILSHAVPGIRRENKKFISEKALPSKMNVLENGIRYHLDPLSPGGTGLFLDQRENRRWILHSASQARVLNLFAYTCGFSVAAAVGGAMETVNVDLSRRSLGVGKENFSINHIDPSLHQFLVGDVFQIILKLTSRQKLFDVVILDPPSSSRSKSSGHFSVKQDFGKLITLAARLVVKGGRLFCSTNLADWNSKTFDRVIEDGAHRSGKKIAGKTWMPQPFDFPTTAFRPSHLKSVWLQLA